MRQFKSPISRDPSSRGRPQMGYPKWAQYPIVTLASQTGVNVIWASGGLIKGASDQGLEPLFRPSLGAQYPIVTLASQTGVNVIWASGGPIEQAPNRGSRTPIWGHPRGLPGKGIL